MELVPWRPFGQISSLRKEMDRIWNRVLHELPSMEAFTEEWLPSVDLSETKDNFSVKAELPGVDPKDVKVSLSGDILTIRGEKKKEEEAKKKEIEVKVK